MIGSKRNTRDIGEVRRLRARHEVAEEEWRDAWDQHRQRPTGDTAVAVVMRWCAMSAARRAMLTPEEE